MSGKSSNTSSFLNVARVAFEASRQVSASIVKGIQGPFLDYEVDHASTILVGPWQVKRAINKTKSTGFCVWSFDKQSFAKTFNLGQQAVDRVYHICKKDARQCTLLRHPCILRVVEPIYETKNRISFVSEGVKMTVGALNCDISGTVKVDTGTNIFHSLVSTKDISELEIKFGLVCISEALKFLHEKARLVHLSLSPHSVLIGDDNSFKLCGFQHCHSLDGIKKPEFDFSDTVQNLYAVNNPILEWTAPELVDVWTVSCSKESDCFSFALLALWLLRGERMIPSGCSLEMYNKMLTRWNIEPGEERMLPHILVILRRQLSTKPDDRPSMSECLSSLSADGNIRALLFLRNSVNKTVEEKNDFLKSCLQGTLVRDFGRNLTSTMLLPFVLDCLRVHAIRRFSVQVLMKLCDTIDKVTFENDILPVIQELLESGNEVDIAEIADNVRTFARFQGGEMTLSILKASSDKLCAAKLRDVLENIGNLGSDYPSDIRQKFCLLYSHIGMSTDSGQVRLVCLRNLTECSDSLTHSMKNTVFENTNRIAQVDKSSQTTVAIATLIEGMCAHSDIDFSSKRGLPLLSPMLSNENLNEHDFQAVYCSMGKILYNIGARKIGKERSMQKYPVQGSKHKPLSLGVEIFETDQSLLKFDDITWQKFSPEAEAPSNRGSQQKEGDQYKALL